MTSIERGGVSGGWTQEWAGKRSLEDREDGQQRGEDRECFNKGSGLTVGEEKKSGAGEVGWG